MLELALLQELGVIEYALQCVGVLTSKSVLGMFKDIENHRYNIWVSPSYALLFTDHQIFHYLQIIKYSKYSNFEKIQGS